MEWPISLERFTSLREDPRMGFDDLARHMAARDKRALRPVPSADVLVAEAARHDRRMTRTRDLILGPLLLIGGIVTSLLVYSSILDFFSPGTPTHPNNDTDRYPLLLVFVALALVIAGATQTIRGIRGPRVTGS